MKRTFRNVLISMIAVTAVTIQSCQKDEPLNLKNETSSGDVKTQGISTFYGPTVPFAGGTARAWVQVNGNGNGDPIAVGINLSANALENLPAENESFVLEFPKNKGGNFYKHMLVDWNPQGHLPFYGLPHFDFHFYIIPNEQRLQISGDDLAGFNNLPGTQYIPPMYMNVPGGVPQMGAHWVDLLAPEFTGGEFTRTYIWGTFDGQVIFFEPMITTAFLLTHPNETLALRQPQSYQVDGWYPTDYRITYSTSPNQYTIALMNLVYHEGE
jgi:hypothetical protein